MCRSDSLRDEDDIDNVERVGERISRYGRRKRDRLSVDRPGGKQHPWLDGERFGYGRKWSVGWVGGFRLVGSFLVVSRVFFRIDKRRNGRRNGVVDAGR